ncbi:LysR family transcriptional regulator [Aromatoleum toluolicum]|uniref:LysR family transcriptional regulator n=1 Tax=Aromatoleum toluolicum TaxID=90060 RepID=A0ABX1NP30_9RHOO|nr:LysR family transcriptional regulator [Aromatoleum toluolicum]NMG01138.1 LysR family transcriptional regulator [Aromatoleum toluolicum]
MDLRDLQYLTAIAEAGSLVRAAERLGITQPTLSKAVARLERTFRVKLIERLARGVLLTSYGQAVVARSGGIDAGVRDMFAELRDLRQGKLGPVTFGVGTGINPAIVAAALKPLSADNDITFTIIGGKADALLRAVRAGDIEFALTIAPSPKGNLAWHKLFDDPMVPITNRNHPLVRAEKVSWEDLAAARWIVPVEGTRTREWFENQFRQRDLQPPVPVISLDSVAGWVGLGPSALDLLALLPASSIHYPPVAERGAILAAPEDWHSDRVVGIVHRSGGYLSKAAERLIESLESVTRRSSTNAASGT